MKIKQPTLTVFRHPWYKNGAIYVCENGKIQDVFGNDSKICILLEDNGFIEILTIPTKIIDFYKTNQDFQIPINIFYVSILHYMSQNVQEIPSRRYLIIYRNLIKIKNDLENYKNLCKGVENTQIYKQELIAKTWHPSRHIEWCLSIQEIRDLIDDGLYVNNKFIPYY